jgi:hypothetical protein
MGTVWSKTAAYFQCDICDTNHTEQGDNDWDGKQVTIQRARDLGWSFDNRKELSAANAHWPVAMTAPLDREPANWE